MAHVSSAHIDFDVWEMLLQRPHASIVGSGSVEGHDSARCPFCTYVLQHRSTPGVAKVHGELGVAAFCYLVAPHVQGDELDEALREQLRYGLPHPAEPADDHVPLEVVHVALRGLQLSHICLHILPQLMTQRSEERGESHRKGHNEEQLVAQRLLQDASSRSLAEKDEGELAPGGEVQPSTEGSQPGEPEQAADSSDESRLPDDECAQSSHDGSEVADQQAD
mmetsp:Transcript_10752/g.30180  ORF Transcript_10752/g.30180 Transcript_10752/m.30180 type:complete len:222 (-) Transcript_10752:1369-2034(-)